MDYKKWWIADGLKNIMPNKRTLGYLEGFAVLDVLRRMVKKLKPDVGRSVIDYGCGCGRMSPAFNPLAYWGVDLNPAAIAVAKEKFPTHFFTENVYLGDLPEASLVLCYTVLLHIADEDLDDVLKQIADTGCEHVIVAEIMDASWRAQGPKGPFYQRDFVDYLEAFSRHGFAMRSIEDFRYEHYKEAKIAFVTFRRRHAL